MIGLDSFRLLQERCVRGEVPYQQVAAAFERCSAVIAPPGVEWEHLDLSTKSHLVVALQIASDQGWYVAQLREHPYGASMVLVRPKGAPVPKDELRVALAAATVINIAGPALSEAEAAAAIRSGLRSRGEIEDEEFLDGVMDGEGP